MPSFKKWLKINKALNLKEKIIFSTLLVIFFGALLSWGVLFYFSKTSLIPNYGGEYIEGTVGQPIHINPVISASNGTDEDLTQMIFSSLFKYDGQGKLMNDLAENYEISEDKTQYTIRLKEGVLWHDEKPLTAADVLFTIRLITDPAYKSPLRSNWQGIEVSSPDPSTVEFKIKNSFTGFLNILTFGVLPKHLWESVSPENFALNNLNLEPIGSGPYKYRPPFQKDSNGNILSYKLSANPNYFGGKPYISKITLNFYSDEEALISAYNTKEIMGISNISPNKLTALKLSQSTNAHSFNIPRYFAVFFNQTKSLPLATDEVREALAYATDRQEIIGSILSGSADPVHSPILEGMVGHTNDLDQINFDLAKANEILESNGWKLGEDGVRAKGDSRLEIKLVTTDWPELSATADIIKSQWEKVGMQVNLSKLSISDIQQNYIRPREYDALLFGQVLGADPDPWSFWHSSQKRDPGLNLSLFGDSDTDKLIDSARTEFDVEKRASLYKEFQEKLNAERPAIFLYSPNYLYPLNKRVQGIDIVNLISPAERFASIEKWYIKTKRIWNK